MYKVHYVGNAVEPCPIYIAKEWLKGRETVITVARIHGNAVGRMSGDMWNQVLVRNLWYLNLPGLSPREPVVKILLRARSRYRSQCITLMSSPENLQVHTEIKHVGTANIFIAFIKKQ